MSEPPSWVLLGLCPAGPFLTSPPSLLAGAPSLRSVSYSTKVFSHAFSHHFGCTRRPCCCPGPQLSPHLAACGDALEVAAFNASSWWQEVDRLGQERSWAAERAALGTPSPSWAAEPSTDTAWLELDLGTRRNVTGQLVDGAGCCPHAAWITAQLGCLSPVQTAQRGCRSPPPKPVTPRRVWGLLLPPPALVVLVQIGIRTASVLRGFFLSSFSSFPTAAISGMNKSILCSCIWCQRAPFVQPNPPPTGALCRGRQEENGDIVRPGAGGGRNAAGVYRLLGAEWGMWVPRKELWGGWGDIRAHPAQQGSSQRDLLRYMTST